MPWRPRRPCPRPGCPHFQPCPDHAPAPFATSTYRERPAIPESLRRQILERDQHACQWLDDGGICGAPASHVDHVVPRAAGGDDHPANLQALCVPHHRRKTSSEAARMRHATR